jgi:murein L,D-transpeptidase YafK
MAAIALVVIIAGVIMLMLPAKQEGLGEIRQRRLEPIRVELAASGLQLGAPIFIRIFKEESELELWLRQSERFALYKTYPICKWSGALGPKQQEGDWQAPEGFYTVSRSQMNPASRFHLAFNLGYPNAFDQAQGRTGSFLMVHGNCVSVGCYAMTDKAIEEIYLIADEALKAGQAAFDVHAFPFRPSPEAFARHQTSPWLDFWRSLTPGYSKFEATGLPPAVTVVNGAYVIS